LEIKIIEDTPNKLLDRRDLKVLVTHEGEGTPKRADLQAKLAAQLGVGTELVLVTKIKALTGQNSTQCNVQIYDDPKRVMLVVPDYLRERGNPSEKKKKKETSAKGKDASKDKGKPKDKVEKPKT
jgi:ribosomal protein S24E